MMRYLAGFLLCVLFVGCSSIKSVTNRVWKPFDKITLTATDNVNPDIDQRPSPVAVKIYELSSRATIDNLDYARAFGQAKTMLSDELLTEKILILQPKQTVVYEIKPNKNTRFVAVLASYQDINNVKWKHIYKIKPTGHYRHEFTLGRTGIVPGKVIEEKSAPSEPTKKDASETESPAASAAGGLAIPTSIPTQAPSFERPTVDDMKTQVNDQAQQRTHEMKEQGAAQAQEHLKPWLEGESMPSSQTVDPDSLEPSLEQMKPTYDAGKIEKIDGMMKPPLEIQPGVEKLKQY